MIRMTFLAPLGPYGYIHAGKTKNSMFKDHSGYPCAEWFNHGVESFGSLRDFEKELRLLSSPDSGHPHRTKVFIIRGKVREPFLKTPKIQRRYLPSSDSHTAPPIEADGDCRWLCLDIDNAYAPISILETEARSIWCSWSEEEKAQYILSRIVPDLGLPDWLSSSDFVAQTSSSALLTHGSWKGHLWFFLSRAVADKTWKSILPKTVDHALFQPVQPHYIAEPRFIGCTDPLKWNRIVYVDQGSPLSSIPDHIPTPEQEAKIQMEREEIRRRNAEVLRTTIQSGVDRSNTAAGTNKWATIVAKIKACNDGDRHDQFWKIYHQMNCLVLEGWVSDTKWDRFKSLWLEICPDSPWDIRKVESMMAAASKRAASSEKIVYNPKESPVALPSMASSTPP